MVLVGCALLASLLGSQGAPKAQASQPVGDVIFNYPYNPIPGASTSLADIPYDKVDHNGTSGISGYDQGYEQAYTQEVSAQYNGTATPDHVVVAGNTLSFYGYGIEPYMDYLFAPTGMFTSQGNSFTLVPANMNFHSFSETGYLFDGDMTQEGSNTYYTGYALILSCANSAGMLENNPTAPNTASLCLYYIDHELWNTQYFSPGNVTTTRKFIATVKSGILNLDTTPYRVSTEIDPATRAFQVYVDGALCATVPSPIGGATGPQGFGFYTGYYSHNCSILTRIRYENITLNTEPVNLTQTTAKVSFIDAGTGTEIRTPETETGYAPLQTYRIVQPLKITYEGDTYYLVSNSRTNISRNDIYLRYQADSTSNETILYYVNAKGNTPESQDLLAQPPVKSARVNGGDWSNGTTDTPVSVAAGDQIQYNITAYAPPPSVVGVPMMMQMSGDSTNYITATSWWNQDAGITPSYVAPFSVQKQEVTTITFVNLSVHFDPATNVASQLLAAYPVWNGQTVLKAWDVTEPDTSVNPDYNKQRVVAWVTPNSSGNYDLYVGGQGGVWMSASPADSYLFYFFSNITSIDLDNFHTDLAVNMSNMFAYFNFTNRQVFPSIDVTHFNTSRVTNMSSMFYNARTAPDGLDLTHFDTSQVTNMSRMFMYFTTFSYLPLPAPPNLDLSHFDTSQVIDMSYMFYGYEAVYYSGDPTPYFTLDLRWFKIGVAPGGTNVQNMFYCYGYMSELHLESAVFSAATITNSTNMFQSIDLQYLSNIYVKTSNDQAWLGALGVDTANVVVSGPPSGTQPAPLPPVSSGGSSSGSSTHTTITDTIPDGLTIDTSTITGTESPDAADDAITWQVDGQQITWTVPNTMLPVDVYATVAVNAGQANGTDFNNTAYVGTEPTNTTYHRFKDGWRVTEQYFVYDNGPTTTQLDADLTTLVSSGATYTVQGPLDSLSGYTYYGYQRIGIDSDITTGTPPAPAYDDGATPVHGSDFATTNAETIKLYYQRKAVSVTINFVDQTGSVIKSPITVGVSANADYYLLMSYFNSFTVGTTTYNYYDYMKNGDNSVADIAPTVTPPLTPPSVGSAPLYPDGSVPTFPASMMNTDRNVTLCFTPEQAVTVHFLEDGNPSHVLHQDETYFVSGPFDPSAATRTDSPGEVPLATDILSVESSSSTRTYTYASHYVLNGGSVQNGFPATTTPPADIILYFSTHYTVTEKFHAAYDPETMTSAPELTPDLVHSDLVGGSVFNPMDDSTGKSMPPDTIGAYYYIGYKLANDSNTLIPGYPPAPLINGVWDDYVVIYVYDKAPGTNFTFTKQDASGNPLSGVIFRLTPRNSADTGWDSADATTVVSDTDGSVSFASLANNTYLLEETATLPGYALPSGSWVLSVDTSSDPVFSFTAQGSPMAFAYDKDTGAYTLTNYEITHLPLSGGWGVIIYTVAGIALLGVAILVLMSSKKKGKHARGGG